MPPTWHRRPSTPKQAPKNEDDAAFHPRPSTPSTGPSIPPGIPAFTETQHSTHPLNTRLEHFAKHFTSDVGILPQTSESFH